MAQFTIYALKKIDGNIIYTMTIYLFRFTSWLMDAIMFGSKTALCV